MPYDPPEEDEEEEEKKEEEEDPEKEEEPENPEKLSWETIVSIWLVCELRKHQPGSILLY